MASANAETWQITCSVCGKASVNWQTDADDKAGAGTAKPQHCRGYFLRLGEPADGLLLHNFGRPF